MTDIEIIRGYPYKKKKNHIHTDIIIIYLKN